MFPIKSHSKNDTLYNIRCWPFQTSLFTYNNITSDSPKISPTHTTQLQRVAIALSDWPKTMSVKAWLLINCLQRNTGRTQENGAGRLDQNQVSAMLVLKEQFINDSTLEGQPLEMNHFVSEGAQGNYKTFLESYI